MTGERTVAVKHLLGDALLWCALAILLAVGMSNGHTLQAYSSISLRYETPISGQAAYLARQYAIRQDDGDVFWPTFWYETKATLTAEFNKVYAECIFYSGDAALIWPTQYDSGTAPGVTDGIGCTVSSALAWTLWGGIDVVGKTVEVDGVTRIVRGVFEGDDLLALLSVRDDDTEQHFTAAELSGGPASPARSNVEDFVRGAGLGTPDSILMDTPAFLAGFMTILPMLVLICYGLALLLRWLHTNFAIPWVLILFAALIGLAILLPGLLAILPDWVIPTRWSDFAFWGTLAKQIGTNLREYLVLLPRLRDVAYKILLVKQAGIAFLSTVCALAICFRWHINSKIAPYRRSHGRYYIEKHS